MKRLKKISIATFALSLMLTLLIPTAFAATQGYVSYLSKSSNSELQGSTRSYTYSNHKISLDITYKEWSGGNDCDISLWKTGFFGDTRKALVAASMPNVGTKYTYVMGNFGSGNYYYYFDNSFPVGSGKSTNAFVADPVNMVSYS